jgi:hypothetical protein
LNRCIATRACHTPVPRTLTAAVTTTVKSMTDQLLLQLPAWPPQPVVAGEADQPRCATLHGVPGYVASGMLYRRHDTNCRCHIRHDAGASSAAPNPECRTCTLYNPILHDPSGQHSSSLCSHMHLPHICERILLSSRLLHSMPTSLHVLTATSPA